VRDAAPRRGSAGWWRTARRGKAGGRDGSARCTGVAAADAQTASAAASQAASAAAVGPDSKAGGYRAAGVDAAYSVASEPCRGSPSVASGRRDDAAGGCSRPAARRSATAGRSDGPTGAGLIATAAGNRHETCSQARAVAAVAVQSPDNAAKLSHAWCGGAAQQAEHGG